MEATQSCIDDGSALHGCCLAAYTRVMSKRRSPRAPGRAPDTEEPPAPEFRTVNEIVAYNLARARRSKGWTQAEAADRLQRQSGKTWTSATLGAAERTASGASGSRTRLFDANELVTFSLVFNQPVSYFFLPPDVGDRDVVVFMHHQIDDKATLPFGVAEFDLLECAVPLRFSAEVIDGVNRVMRKRDQIWSPGTPDIDWYRPEEVEEYGLPPEVEEEREREKRHEEWEKLVYERQKEVARRAEARLSPEEFGAVLRVHSSEVAKLLADEMAKRGAWPDRRSVTRRGVNYEPPERESEGNHPTSKPGEYPEEPPF